MKSIKKALTALAMILLCSQVSAGSVPWKDPTISLTINIGKNSTVYENIPWTLNMVVLDAMKMADGINFTGEWNRGLGQWMVTSIDKTENQGAGGKNWLLCVNGFVAGAGAGSYVVAPDSKIKWVFDAYSPIVCK